MGIPREFQVGFGCTGQRRQWLFGVLPRVVLHRVIVDVALEGAEGRQKERSEWLCNYCCAGIRGITLSALPTRKTVIATINAKVKLQTSNCSVYFKEALLMCKNPDYQIIKKQEKEIRERITQLNVNYGYTICIQSDKGNLINPPSLWLLLSL